MDTDPARERILDAAEDLFYARGIRAVGMDLIRDTSGVTLRRLYQSFPTKDLLVEAYLARRDARWLGSLAARVEAADGAGPRDRLLSVFDWLADWFAGAGFRGCAFINSYGELGGTSPEVAAAARRHKDAFHAYLGQLANAAGASAETGAQIALLAEGAMAIAAISGEPESARRAKRAAESLLTLETGRPGRAARAAQVRRSG